MAGVNRISERILTNASAAIAGMVRAYVDFQPSSDTKPLIGATMFGVTTPYYRSQAQFSQGPRDTFYSSAWYFYACHRR
ncbi:MAG: Tm-1-like ATP-binding domain-containing protein [Ktedonobacteraceae bacterium]